MCAHIHTHTNAQTNDATNTQHTRESTKNKEKQKNLRTCADLTACRPYLYACSVCEERDGEFAAVFKTRSRTERVYTQKKKRREDKENANFAAHIW